METSIDAVPEEPLIRPLPRYELPARVRMIGALTGALGIGGLVLAVMSGALGQHVIFDVAAPAATICTFFVVERALRRHAGAVGVTLAWSVLPPTILFIPTAFGMAIAATAGVIAGALLLPLVELLHREPARVWSIVTIWLSSIAALIALGLYVGQR